MSLDFYLSYEVEAGKDVEVFWANITHNLGPMADKAGIYRILWRPHEYGYSRARDIIGQLRLGLTLLEGRSEVFDQYNSPNGWGVRENFVGFCHEVLDACKKYPSAEISASR